MIYFKSFFIVAVLVAFVAAAERSECDTKHNVTEDDWTAFKADITKAPEKILCAIQCGYLENGALGSDGIVNPEKIEGVLKKYDSRLDAAARTEIIECMKKIPAIHTCADVRPLVSCFEKWYTKN